MGSISNSVTRRNSVFAPTLARNMANGSLTARRRELNVSLFCSRRKLGCNIREAANRNASHSSPGPKRRDSAVLGSKVKLNRTTTIRTNTIVVVSNSRERNSVRSSLPSSVAELAKSVAIVLARLGHSEIENGAQGCARIGVVDDCARIQADGARCQCGNFRFAVEAHQRAVPMGDESARAQWQCVAACRVKRCAPEKSADRSSRLREATLQLARQAVPHFAAWRRTPDF